MSNGSKKLEWYGDDIRYKENGKWKDYDSSLKEIENKDLKELEKTDVVESNKAIAQYKMVNTEGNSKQYFPEELGKDTPIIMKKDKYEIAFSQKTEKGEMPKKSDGDYEVIYTGEDSRTQYISLNNGVKENVIFNSRPAENTITYEYVLNGMYMELDEKTNVIGIYDEKGKKKAYISSPYLCDSTGTNYSFNIKYDIKNNGDTWTVTEALDEKFLNSKDTKYPVTLDTTMYWTSKDTVDASNPTSGYPANYVIDGGNEMLVGKISEGFYGQAIMKWRGLEERLKNKFISLAVLNIDIKEVVGNPVINIYPVEENWDISQVTWNTKPSNSDELISSQTGFEQGKKYNLDVKKWVEKIAFGEIPEAYGIALCTGTEENMLYMRICGTATNKAPMFVVDYFDPIDMNGKYYGDFNITGEYQEDTGKIDLNWEDYGDGSGKELEEYMIATRKNDGDFKMVARTSDLECSLDIDSDTTDMDVRLVAIRKDGKYLSNILSYSINSETGEENQDEAGTYSAVTRDTDGDGLEDGYEIWDFKTKWNTETEDSTETEPKYVQDSDGDGLPDGYEVFTLGTDPAVKNEDGKDSDGDGWSDVREYREGTDPWLVDSDFDEVYDPDDFGTVNPRKTDNP
ncbi:DNRLRE domain-containing protein [Eubacterium sp. CAG:161]|uniref:DNRLRE domain-containing protein n=1 Tax=Eubacterium sp. CAG:161 TaxID=1262881 RepID=UPI00033494C8|nr:DNRLRE domain-containing protein [Eubacterium sp. CAG:161]CCY68156.1 rHS repeat-associated core domain protein [Eubacterium sp. CAG:161]